MKLQCPKCNTINQRNTKFCKSCAAEFIIESDFRRTTGSTSSLNKTEGFLESTGKKGNETIRVVSILLWIGVGTGVVLGALIFVAGMSQAKSAPQEASISAIALVLAVLPYCLARAFDEAFRKNKF